MKIFLISFLLSAPILAFNYKIENNSLIKWKKDIQLTYKDFLGWPPSNSNFDAYSSIRYDRKALKNNDSIIVYDLVCYFEKNNSWFRGSKNQELLNHETTHFNIAELYMRKLRFEALNQKYYPGFVAKLWDSLTVVRKEVETQYDLETNFSKNLEKQEQWRENMLEELDKLKSYENSIITIRKK
jgi:hypothetical protein